MQPFSDRELNDETLADEIRLLGDLVLAASTATRHLTQVEVDRILNPGLPASGPSRPQAEDAPPAGKRDRHRHRQHRVE